jgi:hypothetical protein
MTLLPIVERELRVVSRRAGTYRMRVQIAGMAAAAFAVTSLVNYFPVPVPFARILFWGLSGCCFAWSALAGRLMTADCISVEKREGTLGLLFLTDLKGFDVVLGKLAATSVDGFYRMLAIMPILSVPLLMGGLTSGEFWRMVLVLSVTFVFSLTIGLCASSMHREQEKAMGSNLALLVWFWGVPPALGGAILILVPGVAGVNSLFFTCPVFGFLMCDDTAYRAARGNYWGCIGTMSILTFLLLWLACRITPRSWQDKPEAKAGARSAGKFLALLLLWLTKGITPRVRRDKPEADARERAAEKPSRRRWWASGAWEGEFRKWALDRNAYLWLAGKPRVKGVLVWALVAFIASTWLVSMWAVHWQMMDAAGIIFSVILNVALVAWITTEACRRLAMDKKAGAFELTLSTPLRERDILRGQQLALRRQFLKPAIAALLVESLVLFAIAPGRDAMFDRCFWVSILLVSASSLFATAWYGMLAGLNSKTYGIATVKTTTGILAVPALIFAGVEISILVGKYLFATHPGDLERAYQLGCWLATTVLAQLWFAFSARRRLYADFRRLALEPVVRRGIWGWARDLISGSAERKAAFRRRVWRGVAGTAAVVAVVALAAAYDVHRERANFPKPVLISISPGEKQSPRIYQSRNALLIHLPDGSVWTWGYGGRVGPPALMTNGLGWAQVSPESGAEDILIGLKTNGMLWKWSIGTTNIDEIGTNTDFAEFSSSSGMITGRKRDGTLWTRPLKPHSASSGANFVRLGTHSDWKSIPLSPHSDNWGMRSNGTLWAWGTVYWRPKGLTSLLSTNYDAPVQVCAETNFVDFYDGIRDFGIRDSSNKLWSFNLKSAPQASASITNFAELRAQSGLTASRGIVYQSNDWASCIYEVRKNGTLWATPTEYSMWANAMETTGPAIQFGQRNDWQAVWSRQLTMLGLTADGTLWTWGLDYEHVPGWVETFSQRIRYVGKVFRMIAGNRIASVNLLYGSQDYPTQTEPRPLMRLVMTNSGPGP